MRRVALAVLATTMGWTLLIGPVLRAQAPPPVTPATAPSVPAPAPGDVVAPFEAEGVDGARKQITYPKGSTTVLLFFLSSCPTCHKMIPEWNKAYEKRPKGLQVFGVIMDKEAPGFFMATPIAFPVLRSPSRDFLNGYKVHRAPVTMRIQGGGKVEDASVGFIDGIRLGQLFRAE